MEFIYNYLNKMPSSPIFHYTSQKGLIGILKSRCIWATNIHYLNDSSEFAHALDLAKYEIFQLKKNVLNEYVTVLTIMEELIESVSRVHIFVCSFSEEGDLLSQWRSYCNEGCGFSVGFHYSQLESPMREQGFTLLPCIYNDQVKMSILKELIQRTFDEFQPFQKELVIRSQPTYDNLVSKFIKNLVNIAPVFKHHSFYEEKEWRMVSRPISINNPQVDYREGKSVLTPYFRFTLVEADENLSFGGIIVGPALNNDLSMNSLSNMLHAMNIKKHGGIRCSQIPYRGPV